MKKREQEEMGKRTGNGIALIRRLVAQCETNDRPMLLMRDLLASFDEERGAAIGETQRLDRASLAGEAASLHERTRHQ